MPAGTVTVMLHVAYVSFTTAAPHRAFPPAQYEMNRRFVGSDNPELRQFGASNNLVRRFHRVLLLDVFPELLRWKTITIDATMPARRVLRVHDMKGAGTRFLVVRAG